MAVKTAGEPGGPKASRFSQDGSTLSVVLKYAVLLGFTGFCLYSGWLFLQDGSYGLAGALFVVVLVVVLVYVRRSTVPLRWIAPGLVFLIMFQIYPVFFTAYTSFTNYSTGRNVEKALAIKSIEGQTYVPEGAPSWEWTAFKSPDDATVLWIADPATGDAYLATPGEEWIPAAEVEEIGELGADGVPLTIGEYAALPTNQRFLFVSDNQGVTYGTEDQGVQITGSTGAQEVKSRYLYDSAQDAMIDEQTGEAYLFTDGIFTAASGKSLSPGSPTFVGLDNYTSLLTNPQLRGPFLQIFGWTFIWAFLSVLETFILGLFLAITMNNPDIPFQRLLRVLLIVPYAIPPFITVKIWVGLLNPILGVIGSTWNPGWFTDPFWSKVGILVVNMWLGYPYMFLIILGALQGIPQDQYEAAKVDGANPFQQFRRITLPLLLVAIGPLLIGSFAFNFNNFAVIDLYAQGGPPIPGGGVAGYTDILISYTYKLAFGGARGNDYGLAAAVSVVIFVIVGAITIANFRYTGQLEEVSENV